MATKNVNTTEAQVSGAPRRLRPSIQRETSFTPKYDFSDLNNLPPVNIAFEYTQHNWYLVPVDPRTDQKVFSDSNPTNDMQKIQDWITQENLAFGIATGRVSGIVVLRCKGAIGLRTANALLASCDSVATLRSSAKAETYFLFRAPENDLPCHDNIALGCDFLGEGGHFVPWPSSWKSQDATIATLPDKIRSLVMGTESFGLADMVATGDFAALEQAIAFEAAQAYKKLGWKLVELAENGDQIGNPTKYYLPKLWENKPDSRIGIATGKASGIVGMWFSDNVHKQSLEAQYGTLPLPQITGRGFVHCFRAPQEKYASKKLLDGIEYVGEDDYLHAPPSIIEGKKLVWHTGKEISPTLPELPEWLHNILSGQQAVKPLPVIHPNGAQKAPLKGVSGQAVQFGSAAQQLTKQGWLVFPLKTGDKPPRTKNGFKDATRDGEKISKWWKMWPRANVGVQTGAASGIVVLDVDVKNNQQGLHSLTELEKQHGKLVTLRASTPSGGLHLFFRAPRQEVRNREGFMPGLDLRGDGGFIVVAPSRVGGKEYRWLNSFTDIVDMPEWLITLVKTASQKGKGPTAAQEKLTYTEALKGVQEGSRNGTIFRFACKLRQEEWEFDEALVLVKTAAGNCEPPLDEEEAIRCLESAWRYNPPAALSDLGNAERFVSRYGDRVRYIQEKDRWLVWADHWWEINMRAVFRMARGTIKSLRDEATAETDEKRRKLLFSHSRKSESAQSLENMLEIAALEISIRAENLDRGNLVAFSNGVYDPATKKLRKGRREDLLTKHAPFPYIPSNKQCLLWLEHKGTSPKSSAATVESAKTWQKQFDKWLNERCELEQGFSAKASDLCTDFSDFVGDTVTPRRLGDLLIAKGFVRRKSNVYWYDGIRLRS